MYVSHRTLFIRTLFITNLKYWCTMTSKKNVFNKKKNEIRILKKSHTVYKIRLN